MKKYSEGDTIIYSLNIGYIQSVAKNELGRKLSDKEIEKVINEIDEYISWSDLIRDTLEDLELK